MNKIKPFNEIQWVSTFFDNSVNLESNGIERIKNFVFLWNIFESIACKKNANLKSITKIVNKIHESKQINDEELNQYLQYFIKRYSNSNGHINIDGLLFRNNKGDKEAKELINNVLRKELIESKEILKALLFILYRFRNNLFHGGKQITILNDQIDNFVYANNILKDILLIIKQNQLA